MTELPFLFKDDIVLTNNGGPGAKKYKFIRQMSHVNYLCVDEAGDQWKVRVSPSVIKAPEGTEWNGAAESDLERFFLGNVVFHSKVEGKQVIIKTLADDRYSLAPLNGDGTNRYLRGAHASHLTRTTAE